MTGQGKNDRIEQLLDIRVRERYLKEEALKPEEVQAHLDSLPDCEANAEWVDLPALYPEEAEAEENDAGAEDGSQD